MYLITCHSTFREDADLVPAILLAKGDNLAEIVDTAFSEIKDSIMRDEITEVLVRSTTENWVNLEKDENDKLRNTDDILNSVSAGLKNGEFDCICVTITSYDGTQYDDVYTVFNV